MSSNQTRQRILKSAISLFNEMGLVNVRLQHICDDTIISLGNITYHYKTKDDIIEAIWQEVQNAQVVLLAEFRTLPLFEDIDRYLEASFTLQQQYKFFYNDTLEVVRAYPKVGEAHRQHIQWQARQLGMMFQFNQARGVFAPAPDDDFYHFWAEHWLWALENWMHRRCVMNESTNDFKAFYQALWGLLIPVFTEQGRREYEQLSNLKKLMKDENGIPY